MKLAVIFGMAALLGWVEAGLVTDFADQSDPQLRQLSKLAQATGSDLQKKIGENVARKLAEFEAILKYIGFVKHWGEKEASKILKDNLVSTEEQYANMRKLLSSAEEKLRNFRSLLS